MDSLGDYDENKIFTTTIPTENDYIVSGYWLTHANKNIIHLLNIKLRPRNKANVHGIVHHHQQKHVNKE